MWPLSGLAREALAQSHTAVSRVDVWHSGRPVYVLDVVSGQVSAEADRPVMRNLTATLADPTGRLSGGDVDDLLSPYSCELAPHRGVRFQRFVDAGGTTVATAGLGVQPLGTSGFGGVQVTSGGRLVWVDELAPLGVFGLTNRSVNGDGSISVTGQDRAMGYQGPMDSALAISGGTPVEVAVARLLATRNRGVTFRSWATGFTCGPLLFAPGIDVWREALTLAKSVGGTLFHDRIGGLVFAPALPASRRPVARFAEGDGLLLTVDRAEDSDTIHNVVVVESAKTATGGVIRAVAEDTDPTSPTYAAGRYGRRVVTLPPNQHIGSVAQAQQAATTELVRELGRSETVAFTAVPDPALDPMEAIVVHSPRTGLLERGMVVATVTMPLAATEAMQVGVRRSILTRDGQVLDAPDELTAA